MSENYRLEGLKREAEGVAEYLISNVGLLGCDLEIIGALLFMKYQGENKKIEELLESTHKLMEEAKKLLEDLEKEEK